MARFLAWLLCCAACSGEIGGEAIVHDEPALSIVEAARVETRSGASAVAVASLEAPSLLVANPARFEVDILASDPEDPERWMLVGSAFAGRYAPNELVVARVADRTVVLVRLEDREVTLLAGVPGEPHRLRFPVSVYYGRGLLQDIDAADVDGDGDDELLVGGDRGLAVVELRDALDAHPEHPPSLTNTETLVDDTFDAKAVTAADLEGDGSLELVAAVAEQPRAHVYQAVSDGYELSEVELPEAAETLARTACRGRGATLGLGAGARRALGADADGYRLFAAMPARELVSAGARLAALDAGRIAIRGGCGAPLGELDLVARRVDDLALADTAPGEQLLALLGSDEVTLYKLLDDQR
jgi:hypothetical protein